MLNLWCKRGNKNASEELGVESQILSFFDSGFDCTVCNSGYMNMERCIYPFFQLNNKENYFHGQSRKLYPAANLQCLVVPLVLAVCNCLVGKIREPVLKVVDNVISSVSN
ncbi:hypothetical protein Ancab_012687 [Ancistrocladus abbreviatus]